MSINKTHRRLENKPLIMLKNAERQMVELKSATQPISGASIQYDYSAVATRTGTIAAGNFGLFKVSLKSAPDLPIFPVLAYQLYINGTTANHLWPFGSSLNVENVRDVDVHTHFDQASTTQAADGTYTYSYVVRIKNGGTLDINFTFNSQFYYPKVITG